jgi:hypothetical protein
MEPVEEVEEIEESVDTIIERQDVVLFDRQPAGAAKPGRGGRRGGEPAPGETAFGDHVPAFMLRSAKVA